MARFNLQRLVEMQDAAGNFPTSEESSTKFDLVHWCHGAGGVLLAMLAGHRVLGEEAFLDCAKRAAECVWRFGLLRKGVGLCHGFGGSAASLMSMYHATGESKYWHRAAAVIKFAVDHWGEMGVADRPLSLFEGGSGFVAAMCYVLTPADPMCAPPCWVGYV